MPISSLCASSFPDLPAFSDVALPQWQLEYIGRILDRRAVQGGAMTQPRYMPGPLTRRMTAAVVAAFFATTAGASASVDALSLAGVEGSPEWIAVLAHVGYAMSIDCSPPRACYAKSQWIRAYVHCPTRSLSVIERISMDLNGNVVNVSTAEPAPHSIAIATSGRRPS